MDNVKLLFRISLFLDLLFYQIAETSRNCWGQMYAKVHFTQEERLDLSMVAQIK